MFQIYSEWVGKIALFGKASVEALARGALPMCAMWGGVSLSLRGGRKNKINSLALHLPINVALIQSIRFCKYFNFLISVQCVSVGFYTCIQRSRGMVSCG